MLTKELREKLRQEIKSDPRRVVELLEKEPQIIEILLDSDEQIEQERNEKIKYVNMSAEMDRQLRNKANQLKTTQGALIGTAILSLLLLFDK